MAWRKHNNGIKGGFWVEAIPGLDEEVAKRRNRLKADPGCSNPDEKAGLNNRTLIVEELTPLAEPKEEPQILEHLQSLLLKHS